MWKEEGEEGGEGTTPSCRREGEKEGEQEGGGRQAGSGAEPQVGEERVFPVSHEVIHGEIPDFAALLLCF